MEKTKWSQIFKKRNIKKVMVKLIFFIRKPNIAPHSPQNAQKLPKKIFSRFQPYNSSFSRPTRKMLNFFFLEQASIYPIHGLCQYNRIHCTLPGQYLYVEALYPSMDQARNGYVVRLETIKCGVKWEGVD